MDLGNRREVEVRLGADYMIASGELVPTCLFLKWLGLLYLSASGCGSTKHCQDLVGGDLLRFSKSTRPTTGQCGDETELAEGEETTRRRRLALTLLLPLPAPTVALLPFASPCNLRILLTQLS